MTELLLLDGPLDDERLGWVSDLYGQADPRYRDARWVRHLLAENPAGAPVHAFAMAGETPVGHCVVLPMRTRAGGTIGTTGKIEAFFVAPAHRGDTVTVGERPVPLAMAMLRELYDRAEQRGMGLLHSYSTVELGRLHRIAGCRPVTVPARVRATILRPRAVARQAEDPRGRVLRLAAGTGQRLWHALAGGTARLVAARALRPRVEDGGRIPDAALAAADPPPGRWAISGADAPRWFAEAPAVRTVAVGRLRALVRWPTAPGEAAEVVAVDLAGGGPFAAAALLGAVAAATRRAGAPLLRWSSWEGPGTAAVDRAASALGYATVERELTLYCRSSAPPFDATEGFVPTPFISAIF